MRFFLNDHETMIIFDQKLFLSDAFKEDSLIESEFFKNWDFMKLIMFKLRYYNEEEDSFHYYILTKVTFLLRTFLFSYLI